MGWTFKWVSSAGSDFNHDYQVSFTPDELAKGEVFYNYAWIQSTLEAIPKLRPWDQRVLQGRRMARCFIPIPPMRAAST